MGDGFAAYPGVPYNCKLYDSFDDDLEVLPCLDHGPQWWQIERQFAWSCLIWCLVSCSSRVLGKIWKTNYTSSQGEEAPPEWVRIWVGTSYRRPIDSRLELFLESSQLFASSCNIWVWVTKSYSRTESSNLVFYIELSCVALNICHAIFGHIRNGFALRYCFSPPVIIDSLTISPIVLQRAGPIFGGSWLTLVYLRAYQQLTAFSQLCKIGMFEWFSDFTREAIIKALECVLVIFTIAGTMLVFEGLGDIEGFSDGFMGSGMGPISFFSMIYFTFMTISTVGYGDFTPTTVFSRFFACLSVFVGVTFFTYVSAEIIELRRIEASGLGRFKPSRKKNYVDGRGHILVIGGGVTCGSALVLETFLRALTRPGCPEIVLLSESPCTDEVRLLLRQEWTRGYHISFYIGTPLDENDMSRVKAEDASMVFVITDFQTLDNNLEDRNNLLYASHIQRTYPDIEFRLMLVGMSAQFLSSQIGISLTSVYSIEALKAAMMATSVRCPGFSTLAMNLGLPDIPGPDDYSMQSSSWSDTSNKPLLGEVSPWLNEYITGSKLEVYGLFPHERFVGLSFRDAAIEMALEDVVLLAAQVDGSITLNPNNHTITSSDVLFVIATDSIECDKIAHNNDAEVSTWLATFQNNRRLGNVNTRLRRRSLSTVTVEHDDESIHMKASVSDLAKLASESAKKRSESDTSVTPSINTKAASAGSGGSGGGGVGGVGHVKPRRNVSRWSVVKNAVVSAETVAAKGGHTVVVMMETNEPKTVHTMWQQLELIVSILHDTIDAMVPVIVLHNHHCDFQKKFENKFSYENHGCLMRFMEYKFLVAEALYRAGVPRCSRLVTIAPSSPRVESLTRNIVTSDFRLDESNLMFVMLLEQHIVDQWKRHDLSTVFDWYFPRSLNILSTPPMEVNPLEISAAKQAVELAKQNALDLQNRESRSISRVFNAEQRDRALSNTSSGSGHDDRSQSGGGIEMPRARTQSRPMKLGGRMQSLLPHSSSNGLTPGDMEFARRNSRAHCRYAAGRVLPKPHIAAMFSMAFYTPGVLELLEGLINPHKYDQQSIAWSMDVPLRLVDSLYWELALEVMETGGIPLGLLRAGGGDSGMPLPYVVTATPKTDLVLNWGDTIYVVADKDWAAQYCPSTLAPEQDEHVFNHHKSKLSSLKSQSFSQPPPTSPSISSNRRAGLSVSIPPEPNTPDINEEEEEELEAVDEEAMNKVRRMFGKPLKSTNDNKSPKETMKPTSDLKPPTPISNTISNTSLSSRPKTTMPIEQKRPQINSSSSSAPSTPPSSSNLGHRLFAQDRSNGEGSMVYKHLPVTPPRGPSYSSEASFDASTVSFDATARDPLQNPLRIISSNLPPPSPAGTWVDSDS